ncbi:transcription elongation factor GreA [Candidatus Berkelbacteria bacterium]|nr:transcription elongation factor GreA [Candidatus Berkelbacteria bacterium]
MNKHKHEVTPEGFKKLEEELKKLKTVDRPAIVKRMAEARELGDLSENADYHDAREQLAFLEGRIQEVEAMIKNAQVVNVKTGGDTVQMGSKIDLTVAGKKINFEIVGVNEGDPTQGKISSESPVGSSLIGRRKGEVVEVKTPGGIVKYKIEAVK